MTLSEFGETNRIQLDSMEASVREGNLYSVINRKNKPLTHLSQKTEPQKIPPKVHLEESRLP